MKRCDPKRSQRQSALLAHGYHKLRQANNNLGFTFERIMYVVLSTLSHTAAQFADQETCACSPELVREQR